MPAPDPFAPFLDPLEHRRRIDLAGSGAWIAPPRST
jgi:hypothetical protein